MYGVKRGCHYSNGLFAKQSRLIAIIAVCRFILYTASLARLFLRSLLSRKSVRVHVSVVAVPKIPNFTKMPTISEIVSQFLPRLLDNGSISCFAWLVCIEIVVQY